MLRVFLASFVLVSLGGARCDVFPGDEEDECEDDEDCDDDEVCEDGECHNLDEDALEICWDAGDGETRSACEVYQTSDWEESCGAVWLCGDVELEVRCAITDFEAADPPSLCECKENDAVFASEEVTGICSAANVAARIATVCGFTVAGELLPNGLSDDEVEDDAAD